MITGRDAVRWPGQNQFVWQIWDGRRWQMLGIVDVARDDTSTRPELAGQQQPPAITSPGNRAAASTPPVLNDGAGGPGAGATE